MIGTGSPLLLRWPHFLPAKALLVVISLGLLLLSFPVIECSSPYEHGGDVISGSSPGHTPRRLLVGWTIKKFFLAKTPETLLTDRTRTLRSMSPGCDYGLQFLYSAVLSAGKHTAARSSLIDTSVEDIMVAFFRLAEIEKAVFPLQWYAIENALNRSHQRAIQTALRRQSALEQDYDSDPEREKPLDLTVPEYTWLLGQQVRETDWFFDGNTFHKRGGASSVPEKLTDHDLGFMKSLPFNVLRIARGIQRQEPTKTVAHLISELAQRGVKTGTDFLLKTNFLDLLFSTSVIDETFLQLDILSEYISNWEDFKTGDILPPSIPLGTEQVNLLETLMSKKSTREKYPKCPTMKCYVESVWSARAEHPIDREAKQNEEEDPKKKPSSEPFAQVEIRKTTANSLKLVVIGNTGREKYLKPKGLWGGVRNLLKMNEFVSTVQAMKEWHQRESVDIALGLGDFLNGRGLLSVRDPDLKTKWHDVFVEVRNAFPAERFFDWQLLGLPFGLSPVFVPLYAYCTQEGGLDIPWYIVNGEAEARLSSSAPFRYNYTRQDVNFHNPNWLHKAVITMVANLTTAEGASEDQEFTVHVISIDTWMLFGGTPFCKPRTFQLLVVLCSTSALVEPLTPTLQVVCPFFRRRQHNSVPRQYECVE